MSDPAPFESFRLLGQGWTCKVVDSVSNTEDLYGYCNDGPSQILVKRSGSEFTREMQQITFWHECMHAAMIAIGRKDLNNDEAFVDLLARAIHEILTTGKKPRG